MNKINIFENTEFGKVRTTNGEKGQVLFCGTDVARVLGYKNPQKAVRDHCKRGVIKRSGVSVTVNQHGKATEQITEMNYIVEGDVFRLIASSKLPQAEKFEKWVFEEVLPSIRKYGMYATNELLNDVKLLKQTKDTMYEHDYFEEDEYSDEDDDLDDEIVEVSEKMLQLEAETTKRLEELKLKYEKNHRLIERFKNIRPLNKTGLHQERIGG